MKTILETLLNNKNRDIEIMCLNSKIYRQEHLDREEALAEKRMGA